MGRRLNALLDVSLILIAYTFVIMVPYLQFIKPLLVWPFYSMAYLLAWAIIILALLAMAKRDFSTYGVSPRSLSLDLRVAAILIIPLCFLDILSYLDVSSVFNAGGLISILILAIIVVLIPPVTAKLSAEYQRDKVARAALILAPAAAMGAFILVPMLVLPGTVEFTYKSIDYFILAFVFVGPVEELIFRGYIQSRLNEAFGRPHQIFGISWGAGLIIASLLFGLIHVFNGFDPSIGMNSLNLPSGIIASIMGLTMGILREKTGSIVAPAILHGALDFAEAIF